MDTTVDALIKAYDEFVSSASSVLEAVGFKSPNTDAALETFKQRWEIFRVACDQAEEFVESMKQRIGSECLVDEATGAAKITKANASSSNGIPPISAVRLEQMSKAVRWLVIELQHGSGAGHGYGQGHGHGHGQAFDARFSEDGGQ